MEGNETILFVDDEDYLAEVGREMLEDYGYQVDTATDPASALALFEQHPDRYHLLISDYTMPGMKGDELIMKIQALRSGLPVILCSGTRLDTDGMTGCRISKLLLKPFDMDELLAAVRQVLDTSAGE